MVDGKRNWDEQNNVFSGIIYIVPSLHTSITSRNVPDFLCPATAQNIAKLRTKRARAKQDVKHYRGS